MSTNILFLGSGPPANNLMCSNNATYCPDPVHLGKYLTDDQVLKARKGLIQWQ
jgi:hypothetical protein